MVILRRSLEGDRIGLGHGHALSFQKEIAEILVSPTSPKQSFDIAVDGLHHAGADSDPAVIEDAVQVIEPRSGGDLIRFLLGPKKWESGRTCTALSASERRYAFTEG